MKNVKKRKNSKSNRSTTKVKPRRASRTNKSIKRKSKLQGKINAKNTKTVNARRLSKTSRKTNRKTKSYSGQVTAKVSSRTEKIYRYSTSDFIKRKFHEIRLAKKHQLDLTDEENQDVQFVYDKVVQYLPKIYKKVKKKSDIGIVIIYYNGFMYDAVSTSQRADHDLEQAKGDLYELVERLIGEIKKYKKFNPIILLSELGIREYPE